VSLIITIYTLDVAVFSVIKKRPDGFDHPV